MRWAILAAVLALAFVYFLYSGSLSLISSLTSDSSARSGAETTAGRPPVAAGRNESTAPAQTPSSIPSPAPLGQTNREPVVPPSGSFDSSGPKVFPGVGGRVLRRQVVSGLKDVRSRLASCPDSRGVGAPGGADDEVGPQRPSVLILDVVTRDGTTEILDVSSESRGAASAQFLSCARALLRGRIVETPIAKAGRRMHVAFPLGAL